jgi:hypothetical protein
MNPTEHHLTPHECFIGATVCAATTVWLLLAARYPSLRFGFVWEGANRPMSGFGFAGSAICSASFMIVLLGTGFHYTPVTDHGRSIIVTGFIAFAAAFARDVFVRP